MDRSREWTGKGPHCRDEGAGGHLHVSNDHILTRKMITIATAPIDHDMAAGLINVVTTARLAMTSAIVVIAGRVNVVKRETNTIVETNISF